MKIKKIEFYNFSVESQRKTAQKISKGFEEYKLYLDSKCLLIYNNLDISLANISLSGSTLVSKLATFPFLEIRYL